MGEVEPVENDPSEERAWCDLPPEILDLIAKKLGDISDFIVFRAVCKSWRSCECNPPSQLPWILELRTNIGEPNLHFYSVFSDRIHTINCPKSRGKIFCRPSHHYLLVGKPYHQFSPQKLELLNPLTNNEVDLPLFEQGTTVCGVEWIGPDPSGRGELVVFSGFSRLMKRVIILWRPGDRNTVQFGAAKATITHNCLYCKGEIFFVHRTRGYTMTYDVTTQKLVYLTEPIDEPYYVWNHWLVESGGEILRLRMIQDLDPDQFRFDICQLDRGSEKLCPRWFKIESIGDQVLFLDEYRGLSSCASDYEVIGGNCIYLLKGELLYKYDIKDGRAQKLNCPLVGKRKTWFVPRPFELSPFN